MKCLVINLPDSEERMTRIAKALDRMALSYVQIPASDARRWTMDQMSPYVSSSCGTFPSGGELGCFLSHRRCWEIAAASDDELTLILEDDAIPSVEAGDVLVSLLLQREHAADVVYLETRPGTTWLGKPFVSLAKGHTLGSLRSDSIGSAAYLISKAGAEKLLERSTLYVEPVDLFLFFTQRTHLDILAVRPGIFCQSLLLEPDLRIASSTITHRVEGKVKKTFPTRIRNEIAGFCNKLLRYLQQEKRYKADFTRFHIETREPLAGPSDAPLGRGLKL